jgi:hypothetical protein
LFGIEVVSKPYITAKDKAWSDEKSAAYMGEHFEEAHNAVIGF